LIHLQSSTVPVALKEIRVKRKGAGKEKKKNKKRGKEPYSSGRASNSAKSSRNPNPH